MDIASKAGEETEAVVAPPNFNHNCCDISEKKVEEKYGCEYDKDTIAQPRCIITLIIMITTNNPTSRMFILIISNCIRFMVKYVMLVVIGIDPKSSLRPLWFCCSIFGIPILLQR